MHQRVAADAERDERLWHTTCEGRSLLEHRLLQPPATTAAPARQAQAAVADLGLRRAAGRLAGACDLTRQARRPELGLQRPVCLLPTPEAVRHQGLRGVRAALGDLHLRAQSLPGEPVQPAICPERDALPRALLPDRLLVSQNPEPVAVKGLERCAQEALVALGARVRRILLVQHPRPRLQGPRVVHEVDARARGVRHEPLHKLQARVLKAARVQHVVHLMQLEVVLHADVRPGVRPVP
mmetsp:Transcript_68624/g.221727  ORF Transcript_68624/g.221727 Transcript_68624/m.221727 type:complete len:239 (+) Transcript_68624:258-974(+)